MATKGHIVKREAKTQKEVWLKALIERRGKKYAAVALANKTIRTAFAMLTQGTKYKAVLLAVKKSSNNKNAINEDKNQLVKSVRRRELRVRNRDLTTCSRKYHRARDSFSNRARA